MNHANQAFKSYGRPLVLGRYAALPLVRARGARVRSVRGMLWITQEGDATDHIVNAGEDFVVSRDGVTLVAALDGPSTVVITPPAPRDGGVLERWLQRSALAGCARQGDVYGTR